MYAFSVKDNTDEQRNGAIAMHAHALVWFFWIGLGCAFIVYLAIRRPLEKEIDELPCQRNDNISNDKKWFKRKAKKVAQFILRPKK